MADRTDKDIFAEALDLPAHERGAFLETECRGDANRRARIQALLAAHDEAGGFLASPTVDHPAPRSDAPPATPPTIRDMQPGDRVGAYTLGRLVGEGGFGRVFRAEQHEPVRRTVALKILKAGMESRRVIARFEGERQALAMMDHPNVARVFDAGQAPNGRPYFVMEYVDGEPITHACDRARMGVRERLDLFELVCRAVQHAHTKGVMHRDLKPSNVMVAWVDGRGVPKVIDFGIAKAVGEDSLAHSVVTVEGQMIGTPAYMSPEQFAGAASMDTRSDVYTLGVLLYELLTGVPPLDLASRGDLSLASLAKVICEFEPARPSSRVVRAGDETKAEDRAATTRQPATALRGDLDWIVMRAMAKDPDRRYQSAAELGDDLRRHLNHQAVEAGPPGGVYRVKKFATRHRTMLTASGIALLALVSALAASLVFGARADADRRRAEHELVRAGAFVEFATTLLSGLDPAVARQLDTELLQKMLDDARTRLDEKPPRAPDAEAQIRNLVGTALYKLAAFEQAEHEFTRALELAHEALGPDDPLTLEIKTGLNQARAETQNAGLSRRGFAEISEDAQRVYGPEHRAALKARFNVAATDRQEGRYEQAYDALIEIYDEQRRILGERDPDTMSTLNSLATTMTSLGRSGEAIPMLEAVIEFQLGEYGEDHPHTLATMNNLADALGGVGRTEEQVRLLERVLEIKKTILPANDPSLVVALNNLGHTMRRVGRLDDAERYYREALAASVGEQGQRDWRALVVINGLSSVLIDQGRVDEALGMLSAARQDARELLPNEHPLCFALESGRIGCLLKLGRTDEAVEAARALVADSDGASSGRAPDRVRYRALLGDALLAAGEPGEAERVWVEASELLESLEAPPPDVARSLYTKLAEVCAGQGRIDDERAWRDRIVAAEDAAGRVRGD